mgnify:CR=1 FL=1
MKRLACLLFLLLPALGQAQEWRIYTHSLGNQGVLIDGQLHGREHAGKRAFYLELVHMLLADLGAEVAPDLYEAELFYLKRQEWALTADDVLWRRSKLGLHCTPAQRQAVADWFAAQAQVAQHISR